MNEKKMNIGELLYQERKKRKLTQKEFVKNIISVSQYSRVEHGEQDLRTKDFFEIIDINKINFKEIEDIFNGEEQAVSSSDDVILEQLADAFYDHNVEYIKSIKKQYIQEVGKENIILQATLMEYILKNKLDKLDSSVIEKISQKLNEEDNWITNKVFLQLFGSSMMLFNMLRLNIYMKKILKTYMDKIAQYSLETQRRIGSICINYLGRIYQEKDRQLLDQTLILLDHISATPDLLMYKLLGKYFESLFNNKIVQSKRILNVLSLSGYKKFIKNLPK